MLSKEKFELLKDWSVITHLHTAKPIDVIYGCVIAGALVAGLPDNANIFTMERNAKLNMLTLMVSEEHIKLARSHA
jgi:hypothetical protein